MRDIGSDSSRPSSSVRTKGLSSSAPSTGLGAGDQPDQRGNQVDLLAVHRHAEVQFQPVDAGASHKFGFDIGIGGQHLHRKVGIDVDRPPGAPQARHLLGDDLQPGRVGASLAQGEIVGVGVLVVDRHDLMHRHETQRQQFGQHPGLGGTIALDFVQDSVANGDAGQRLQAARQGERAILI
jgi:hypothetical protein